LTGRVCKLGRQTDRIGAACNRLDHNGAAHIHQFRYCLGANYMYYPAVDFLLAEKLKLCWARIRGDAFGQVQLAAWDSDITTTYDLESLDDEIYVGNRYLKRQKEVDGRFVPVDLFCSQTLIDALAENPEALPSVSHADFEGLCAELFVRRGFKVDLFRPTKDGGIDFLALKDDTCDPLIFAVQCKQPVTRPNKTRHAVGRPVLQQVYGAAKAWDLTGGIVISGSTYSADARSLANLKPGEMKLYSRDDLLKWITKYRWNEDENQ
jgi:HJR/Mrr/RecB family endonuclease